MDEIELLRLKARAKAKAQMEAEADGEGVSLESPKPSEPDLLDRAKEVGMNALKYGGKALDYAGGYGRVAAHGLENIPYAIQNPGKSLTHTDDLERAFKGEAPTSEEYLARRGMEPSASRTAMGIVKDIAYDPLTYGTFGISALPELKKLMNVEKAESLANPLYRGTKDGLLQRVTDYLGKKSYKSGLKRIDQKAAEFGKAPVSDVLMEHGVTGNAQKIQSEMDRLANEYKASRDVILKEADEAGGRVSMKDAMAPLQEKINAIKASKDPNLQGVANVMQDDLDQYLKLESKPDHLTVHEEQFVTPSQASGFKSSTYNQMPNSAYAEAKRTPIGTSLDKTKAAGLNQATLDAVAKSKGKLAAEDLKMMNDKLGRILTTEEIAAKEANKEANKNALRTGDALMSALSAKIGLPVKKAIEMSQMTGPRTKAGMYLMERAKTPMQVEKNLMYSPWVTIKRQTQDGEEQ